MKIAKISPPIAVLTLLLSSQGMCAESLGGVVLKHPVPLSTVITAGEGRENHGGSDLAETDCAIAKEFKNLALEISAKTVDLSPLQDLGKVALRLPSCELVDRIQFISAQMENSDRPLDSRGSLAQIEFPSNMQPTLPTLKIDRDQWSRLSNDSFGEQQKRDWVFEILIKFLPGRPGIFEMPRSTLDQVVLRNVHQSPEVITGQRRAIDGRLSLKDLPIGSQLTTLQPFGGKAACSSDIQLGTCRILSSLELSKRAIPAGTDLIIDQVSSRDASSVAFRATGNGIKLNIFCELNPNAPPSRLKVRDAALALGEDFRFEIPLL